jgi:hypothetical protein
MEIDSTFSELRDFIWFHDIENENWIEKSFCWFISIRPANPFLENLFVVNVCLYVTYDCLSYGNRFYVVRITWLHMIQEHRERKLNRKVVLLVHFLSSSQLIFSSQIEPFRFRIREIGMETYDVELRCVILCLTSVGVSFLRSSPW